MASADRTTSPVRALREAFGDPKPPDISRKITACVACRKQKIKCHMQASGPPCTRCRKRGLSCTVNRSLQTLLESDTMWKHSIESKLRRLEGAIETVANHVSVPGIVQALRNEEPSPDHSLPNQDHESEIRVAAQPTSWEINIDAESGPEAPPGSYLTQAAPTPSQRREDIISRGIISYERAQECLRIYQKRLDHFPYRILGDHGTCSLESIRTASPFLLASICTVGALHLALDEFDMCYEVFLSEHAIRNFSKANTEDDVRALCIGAFWLSDISWALIGTAVRIATELQLQKSFAKALKGDRSHYLRVRLYLLVYACDHHFSIPFGRPPMTRQCEAIRNVRKLPDCEHATEDDARLVSQVLRWSLCTNIFDTFETNADKPLSESEIAQLRKFNMSLDNLRTEWSARFVTNAHVGNYPHKGVGLQYDFAKLYSCSHAFRGAGSVQALDRSQETSLSVDNIAHEGIIAALSIIRVVTSDEEIQSFFNGLPSYFDIMLAFSVVFLFKVSTKYSSSIRLDIQATKQLVRDLVTALRAITAKMHSRHLLVSLTKGIDGILRRWDTVSQPALATGASQYRQERSVPEPTLETDFAWFDGLLDPLFMGEYDLLLEQDMDFAQNFSTEN